MRVIKVDGGYYARVGDFFGPLASNQNQALEGLNNELETYHPLDHHYLRCKDGTVLHLFQMPSHGWNIRIIEKDGYKGRGVGVQGTFEDTKERAIVLAVEEFGGLL